jgi:hypothetical protein
VSHCAPAEVTVPMASCDVVFAGRPMTLLLRRSGDQAVLRAVFDGPLWLGSDLELYIERDNPGAVDGDLVMVTNSLCHVSTTAQEVQYLNAKRESGDAPPLAR